MRRLAALALLALGLTSCTAAEQRAWLTWHEADPVAAMAYLDGPATATATAQAVRGEQVQLDPPPPPPDYGRCGEWHDLAMWAGFSEADWPTVSRIMYRESRCQPGARNASGASGLMQIMPMWADDCGGVRAELFDPAFNLACAEHVRDVQGWRAWSTY